MFISHKYKVIFVHIQRTGGNSIQKAFQEADPDLIETLPLDVSKKRTKHCFLTDIRDAVDENIFNEYLKFCVVRNPLARMISWHNKLEQGFNKDEVPVKPKKEDIAFRVYMEGFILLRKINFSQKGWLINCWSNFFSLIKKFNHGTQGEFAARTAGVGYNVIKQVKQNAKNFDEFIMLPENHPSGLFRRFYSNQLDYIADNDIVLADRILKFENLNSDFDKFAQEIGFEKSVLPHVNKSVKKNKKNFYSEETKRIIVERFEKDYEYFGYML
jgi:hypothetical protein